jgi:putative flippase GtrA
VNKGVRFLGVGVISTLTYLGVSLGLVALLRIDLRLANVISYLAGMAVSFFGHRHVTFRSRGRMASEGWRFIVTHGVNFTASTLLLMLMVDRWGINRVAAVIVTTVFIMAVSFAILQAWVFRPRAQS